jgi:hypothetical protein
MLPYFPKHQIHGCKTSFFHLSFQKSCPANPNLPTCYVHAPFSPYFDSIYTALEAMLK